MGPELKLGATGRGTAPAAPEPTTLPTANVRNRQAAASCLQASALADDAVTREALRRQAAALLAPPFGLATRCVAC